jgi:hypothetical protein
MICILSMRHAFGFYFLFFIDEGQELQQLALQLKEEAQLIRERRALRTGARVVWRRSFCGPPTSHVPIPSGHAAAAAAQARPRAPSCQGLEEGSGQASQLPHALTPQSHSHAVYQHTCNRPDANEDKKSSVCLCGIGLVEIQGGRACPAVLRNTAFPHAFPE